MKKVLLFVAFAVMAISGAAQQKEKVVMYNLGQVKNIQPLEEIEKRLDKVREILKNDSIKWTVELETIEEKAVGDTLIRYVSISVIQTSLLEQKQGNKIRLGHHMPEWQGQTLEGKTLRLADLRGKVVFLNFWFTRCAPCIAEMPYLNQIKEDYAGKPVEFIALAPEDEETIRRFLQTHDFRFYQIPSSGDYIKRCGDQYPSNILLDKKGFIRYFTAGMVSGIIEPGAEMDIRPDQVNWSGIRSKLDELLGE